MTDNPATIDGAKVAALKTALPELVEAALRARNIALSKLVVDLSAAEWETLKREEDLRRRHWRWLRDEMGAVIYERIRWRWRTLQNLATGAIRRERGPLAIQHEWGAARIEFGRLWLIRCAPGPPNSRAAGHPNKWMIVWRRKLPEWLGTLKYPTPWVIIKGEAP